MEQEILKLAVSQGIFAVLFVFLFLWILKDNKEIRKEMQDARNKKDGEYTEKINEIMINYQETIKDLAKKEEVMNYIKNDVKEIQEDIGDIKTDIQKIKTDVQEIRINVSNSKK